MAICVVGSAWHFLFGWSGGWRPIAWLAPVNESVWEHFKMSFWPGLIWACVAYAVNGRAVKNYWFARICGLWCMPIVMAAISYGYTAAVGRRYLSVDILSFLVAVAVGQFVSFKLFQVGELGATSRRASVVGILATMLVFVLFTYMPPHRFIFEQLQTHEYGILARREP